MTILDFRFRLGANAGSRDSLRSYRPVKDATTAVHEAHKFAAPPDGSEAFA